MPLYRATFERTVVEFHTAWVTAENKEAVQKLYEDGVLVSSVTESKILSEEEPEINQAV